MNRLHEFGLMAATLFIAAFLPSCLTGQPGSGAAVEMPAEAWVSASRAIFDVLAPDYTNYLQNDPEMHTIDGARKMRNRLALLGDWEFMIEQGEALYEVPETSGGGANAPPAASGGGASAPPLADDAGMEVRRGS